MSEDFENLLESDEDNFEDYYDMGMPTLQPNLVSSFILGFTLLDYTTQY